MQLPMLPPLTVSGVAACMLACEIGNDEHYHMQSLQYSAIFTLIWWGSALPVLQSAWTQATAVWQLAACTMKMPCGK